MLRLSSITSRTNHLYRNRIVPCISSLSSHGNAGSTIQSERQSLSPLFPTNHTTLTSTNFRRFSTGNVKPSTSYALSNILSTIYILPEDDSSSFTEKQRELPYEFTQIIGSSNVLVGSEMGPYCQGSRLGSGGNTNTLCVISPTTLQETVECLQLLVKEGVVCVPQGANTGLTGGSVPQTPPKSNSNSKDKTPSKPRPSVVLSTRKLRPILLPVDDGERVLVTSNIGLATLATYLSQTYNRESHSILGSIFLNPTVGAGVAFGSGGTQLRKGPAYTDRSVYAVVNTDGEVIVENHLHVDGLEEDGGNASKGWIGILQQLDQLSYRGTDKSLVYTPPELHSTDVGLTIKSSNTDYVHNICKPSSTASRFNADTSGSPPNRSEGKVLLLASIHDTFPKPHQTQTYWTSFATLEDAHAFRDTVMLDNPAEVPISAEYMNRDCFDIINNAGRATAFVTTYLGTGNAMRILWDIKVSIEALPLPNFVTSICDTILWKVNGLFPNPLPEQMMELGAQYDHHLILTVGEFEDVGLEEDVVDGENKGTLHRFVERMNAFQANLNYPPYQPSTTTPSNESVDDTPDYVINEIAVNVTPYIINKYPSSTITELSVDRKKALEDGNVPPMTIRRCQPIDTTQQKTNPLLKSEETLVQSFRFAAAPAFKTWCVGNGEQGISVDYALPQNHGSASQDIHSTTKTNTTSFTLPPLSLTSKPTTYESFVTNPYTAQPKKRMRYSHFGCNVVHEDLSYSANVDVHAAKMDFKRGVETLCGGKLPSEHGHGIEYNAPEDTKARWKQLDPCNVMNVGIGGLERDAFYKS